MMTKTTSQSRALLKKLAVLPVLAGLIFVSCNKSDTDSHETELEIYVNGKKVSKSDMKKPVAELISNEASEKKIVVSSWETAKALSSEKSTTKTNEAVEAVEVSEVDPKDAPTMPEFPGGMEAFDKLVAKEYKIPKGFKGKDKLILAFVVKADGSLEGIKAIKDLGFGTGEEAVRMMKKSPKWNPGLKDGKPVRVQYHLPILLDTK